MKAPSLTGINHEMCLECDVSQILSPHVFDTYRKSSWLKHRPQFIDIAVLIAYFITFRNRRACTSISELPCVIISDISHQPPYRGRFPSSVINLTEEFCRRSKICIPSKPACMTSIKIDGDIWKIQLLQSPNCQSAISGSCLLAFAFILLEKLVAFRVRED
jgi:hypothetical protein